MLARRLTYHVNSILRAFEACGISPLNSGKVLGEPSQNITRPTPPPSLAPHPSTPKTRSQASSLGREALGLIDSNSPRSQRIKGSIAKISKFGERVHAELDIEVFRHKLLRSQVLDKPRKAVQDRHMLTRARLIDNTDIVRLRKEKEAKKSKSKGSKKGKKAASPSPSMDSTEEEEWDEDAEEKENDDEIVVSESESGGDSELEDVIVVRRRR